MILTSIQVNVATKPQNVVSQLKRWNETGTGMLFKAQADRGPIGDDLRAFRSESEMESMRAALFWNSRPRSAEPEISTFLMPFYSGKANFYLMRTLEVL